MIRRIALFLGGIIQRLVDRTAKPVEVSPMEMEKAKREMEERIELDRKEKHHGHH